MQEEDPSKHEMVAGVIREGEQDSRIRFSLGMTRQGEVSLERGSVCGRTILNLLKRRGDRVQIRANMNCRPLNKVVYQTHEPIPSPEEL